MCKNATIRNNSYLLWRYKYSYTCSIEISQKVQMKISSIRYNGNKLIGRKTPCQNFICLMADAIKTAIYTRSISTHGRITSFIENYNDSKLARAMVESYIIRQLKQLLRDGGYVMRIVSMLQNTAFL